MTGGRARGLRARASTRRAENVRSDRSLGIRGIVGCAVAFGLLACTATSPPTSVDEGAAPPSPAATAPEPEAATPSAAGDVAAPEGDAAEADAAPPSEAARPCRHGERLESGCACPEGACFDICCGPNADCAHPATPGGPSACMLRPLAPPPEAAPAVDEAPRDPPAARPCTDGESLSSGCACERRCIDICCVGSACSHRSGPDGGWAKCVRIPQTR